MYSQTRLTALANARVAIELNQIEYGELDLYKRQLNYLDEQINSCREIAPAEMAQFSIMLSQATIQATKDTLEDM